MNLLDLVILCAMVFLVVKGLLRGFIREMASLAGIILGILFANWLQPQMTAYLRTLLPDISFLPVISFAGIFICVLILCNLLGYVLRLLFRKAFLGWLDRTLGVGLAITKGVILTYLAIVLLTFFVPTQTPLIARSKLAPWIIMSYQNMIRLILPDHYEGWKERIMGKAEETGFVLRDKGKNETDRDEKE
ncbi:MAG: CvpA family protein [Proteobacteria bacterium]|nr:CvpA family protein [Pseudomonadota bacterium]